MTEVNQDRVNQVVEYLQGPCNNLDDVLTDDERDDVAFLQAIDAQIFLCDSCGWWCEVSEMADDEGNADQTCQDCADS